jgi:hypothetical protein
MKSFPAPTDSLSSHCTETSIPELTLHVVTVSVGFFLALEHCCLRINDHVLLVFITTYSSSCNCHLVSGYQMLVEGMNEDEQTELRMFK